MANVEIDARLFYARAKTILTTWENNSDDFAQADAFVVVSGVADEALGYQKSTAIQLWLLGYEFPDTLTLFTRTKIVFLTSQKKGNILQSIEARGKNIADKIPIEILRRGGKDETDKNKALFETLCEYIPNGSKLGLLIKEKQKGRFSDEWNAVLSGKEGKFDKVDVANGIATALALKDDDDVKNIELACKMTCQVMKNFFVEEFQAIIDEGKKVTHDALSIKTEECVTNETLKSKMRFPKEAQLDALEWCYPPIIQSGGKYDLRPSAMSDESNLHDAAVVCSLGVRYRSYCSNLSRTFLVNPEKGKEKNYQFLLELQSFILSIMKDGAACRDIYTKAQAYIETNRPDLIGNFVKSLGFGIGIEFKESAYSLAPKSTKSIHAGMTFNLSVGFQNLENTEAETPNSKNKIYSLLVADIVKITTGEPVILTNFDKDFKDISWEMKDEEEVAPVKKEKVSASAANGKSTAVLKTKLRGEEKDEEMTNEQRRNLHQKQLAEQRNAEGKLRFGGGGDTTKALEKAVFKKFECYRKESLLPKNLDQLRIVVDRRSEAIVLPIYGFPVPFHISTLKSITKNEEGDVTYLRFNFVTPGPGAIKKDGTQPFEDPNSTFIKALTFKSTESIRFADIFRDVNDLKKEIQKREAERKEKADLVEQDKLIEIKGRRPLLLREVFVRPALEGRRLPGDLELHTNGLRYQSALRSDQKIDILFSNIKHLFFQPCDNELIVVLHIHLKNDIMVGRKKTKDIQFYREVTDASFDETGNRKRRYNQGDEDEFAAEQEERIRRSQLNKEFKQYSEKIADASRNTVEVDIPFRELGFQGVPFRQPVLLLPTTDCLVHLIEPPFLVVSISEIEIAHLERVRFGLKSFDLVLVFRDFTRPVQHINTIPSDQLENLKEWLDSVEVPFTEGPTNLSWPQIMKTVNESPADFFNEGGWSFLQPASEDEESEEEESEYAQSSDGFGSDESDSEDYDSEDSGSDVSGSGSDDDDDDDEGEDWDELEKKAARSDRKKDSRDDGSPVGKKKKRRDYSDDEDSDDSGRKSKKKKK